MSKSNVTFCACLIAVERISSMRILCAVSSRTRSEQPRRRSLQPRRWTSSPPSFWDGSVDASNINVDTIASSRTVVLKGSVPSEQQRRTAEEIARAQAKGYTITNQLTIAQK